MFAIALDENSAATPNERSSAIVGNQWVTLDFGAIEKELAVKLLDVDIDRVLMCIDAVNNVKRLKLTNCVAITGTCLEPLRGSVVIEQIDLSVIYDTHQPDLDPQPLISCEFVLPILDSIIEREDCALMHLQFPSGWRKGPLNTEFHAFIERYNEIRRNRGTVHCLECNQSLPDYGDEWIESATLSDHYGTQLHTCYDCLKHYCYKCNIDGEKYIMMNECYTCRRDYCEDCSTLTSCFSCAEKICNDCYKYKCVRCNDDFCPECLDEGESIRKCDYCDNCYCRACYGYDNKAVDLIYTCSRCDFKCCNDCRLQRFRQGELHCAGCIKESVSVLEHKRLQKENEELKVKMEAMKRHIEKLENEELRSRNSE